MNKFLGIALAIFLQTMQVAQGASSDPSEIGVAAPGVGTVPSRLIPVVGTAASAVTAALPATGRVATTHADVMGVVAGLPSTHANPLAFAGNLVDTLNGRVLPGGAAAAAAAAVGAGAGGAPFDIANLLNLLPPPRAGTDRHIDISGLSAAEEGVFRNGRSIYTAEHGFSVLTTAVIDDKTEEVDRLIGLGEDVNAPDPAGETALCVAAENDSLKMITLLLSRGAQRSINMVGRRRTPLQEALIRNGKNSKEIIAALLAAGADVNQLDASNRTPLIVLIDMDDLDETYQCDVVKMLLNHGAHPAQNARASLDQVTDSGNTALSAAVQHRKPKVVRLLLAHGADPTLGRAAGLGSLGMATMHRSGEVTNAILAAIRDRNLPLPIEPDDIFKNGAGETTLVHVIARGAGITKEELTANITSLLATAGGMMISPEVGGDTEELKANMISLLATAGGLRALQMKDESGKWPEEIVNPSVKYKDGVTLKDHMHALREEYALFLTNLRFIIVDQIELLARLENISQHILRQKVNPAAGFTEMEYKKAENILIAYAVAKETEAFRCLIVDGQKILDEMFNVLNAKKPTEKRMADAINALNEKLSAINSMVREGKKHLLLSDFYESLLLLKDKKHPKVNAVIKWADMPFASVAAEDGKSSAGAGAGAASAAMDTITSRFDPETAALDLETLEALSTSVKASRKTLENAIKGLIAEAKAEAAAHGESMEILSKEDMATPKYFGVAYLSFPAAEQDKKFNDATTRALKRYREKFAMVTGHAESIKILTDALKHNVDPNFLWQMLRYAKAGPLYELHRIIEGINASDMITFVTRNTDGTFGAAAAEDDSRSAVGSVVGGRAALNARLAEVPEDRETAAAAAVAADDERVADVSARFPMPATLPTDIGTLEKLFRGDYENIDETGVAVVNLFNALGNGFGGSADEGVLKFRNPKGATATGHSKHDSGKKGLNKDLGKACLKLLQNMEIDAEDVGSLARRTRAAKLGSSSAGAAASRPAAAAMARGGSESPPWDDAEHSSLSEDVTRTAASLQAALAAANITHGVNMGTVDALLSHLVPVRLTLAQEAQVQDIRECQAASAIAQECLRVYVASHRTAAGAGAVARARAGTGVGVAAAAAAASKPANGKRGASKPAAGAGSL